MGFLVIGSTNPTALTPAAKDVQAIVFSVARTETASVLKAVLPADASILSVTREGGTASDAGTSATVTLTAANNAGTVSSKADDVKGSGATTGLVTMSGLPNLEPRPLTGDIQITAVYAETGTASTTGGPWNYVVQFVR